MTCTLKAFRVGNTHGWEIEPAGGKRDWMDQTVDKFAYRCLPLVMANQAGWIVKSPLDCVATWNGKPDPTSTTVRFPQGEGDLKGHITGHFGHGVLTFSLPWLFRTSPGYGLWVRGPSNAPKDNIVALDGIVETDWAPYTFTMNWKIMRRNVDVFFRKGEPVCMLVPFPLALLESVTPEFHELDEDPVLKQDFYYFTSRRSTNIRRLHKTGENEWAMDYMRGHRPDGTPVSDHRKAFKLKEFAPAPPSDARPEPLPEVRLPPPD
ncbi:MAG: DUF6065 family protein [Planctomycetota bacterium]|nr:DUF6065 family protein [Planctomycetota bacterium]